MAPLARRLRAIERAAEIDLPRRARHPRRALARPGHPRRGAAQGQPAGVGAEGAMKLVDRWPSPSSPADASGPCRWCCGRSWPSASSSPCSARRCRRGTSRTPTSCSPRSSRSSGRCAPDTHAGLVFLGFLGMAWLTGAPGELGPGVVVTALGLLVAHVAAALAAAMPVTAGADRRLVLRWARPTAWIAAAVLAACGVVAALEAWSPAGSHRRHADRPRRWSPPRRGGGRCHRRAAAGPTPPGRRPTPERRAQSRLRMAQRSGNSGVNSVERR